MDKPLSDQRARDRFRDEWEQNFAVSANAGSGKTTAISERLAAIALAPGGEELLRKTAVVTFTRKAAAQIGQRARQVLLRRLTEDPPPPLRRGGLAPLDHLERAFFGTIHSFCLLLAQRHGQTLGINLNPAVIAENDDALWEEFLEQDPMQFSGLGSAQVGAFLRHAPLDSVFDLARRLDAPAARRFLQQAVAPEPPEPDPRAWQEMQQASTRQGKGAAALERNRAAAARWRQRFREEKTFLPPAEPEGKAARIEELYTRFFAPLKTWLAGAGAVLAAELALRYRAWRFHRGVQTYADQIEAALAVLQNEVMLEKVRAEDWRIILDEAQDTDAQQFAVLVEIARPPGARLGTWPEGGGPGPRPGHFCLVGDGQQAIYGDRADIRNFQRQLAAFGRGDGGELLMFDVTFRTPKRVIAGLNATLPEAFSAAREHNLGLPPAEGAPAPLLQVPYEALVAGPENADGCIGRLLLAPVEGKLKVEAQLAAEVRQIAAFLRQHGPGGVGARTWGEICLLAPRNDWLVTARKELEAAGLKVALQMRRNRNGDNPAYAWTCGLLAALCDPDNAFEWVGVLREVFAVSDAGLAAVLRAEQGFHWDEPERHPEPLRSALAALKPFVERVDAEGEPLERFAAGLFEACELAEKARRIDAGGALNSELERLQAQAAELGLEGAGPREWSKCLLAALDEGRPAGKPSDDALNLLTSHSAKGLEWPVVIPLGLWRSIGKPPETGLRLVPDGTGEARVFFDRDSLPEATKQARERERRRELVRLLYVTLTRSRRVLVLPWGTGFAPTGQVSFAELWGAALEAIAPLQVTAREQQDRPVVAPLPEPAPVTRAARPPVMLPARILPHQLARTSDRERAARHESTLDELPAGGASDDDPVDYGLWWHEVMEFFPWEAGEAEVEAHLTTALLRARQLGWGARAEGEIAQLQAGEFLRGLRSTTARRLAELAIFAPLPTGAWIDGVIDLVVHDEVAGTVRVIDWKTNRPRPGEDAAALLKRLAEDYRPQLAAYGAGVAKFFPGCIISLELYASAAGAVYRLPSI
ncbi:MAG: UvrD-helicase domain-containing protein [Opitutaceae bacterium]